MRLELGHGSGFQPHGGAERRQFPKEHVEGEADKLIMELLKDLYSGQHDPLRVIMLRDLYDLLEKVVDRCRDAGNVLSQIVLKYT